MPHAFVSKPHRPWAQVLRPPSTEERPGGRTLHIQLPSYVCLAIVSIGSPLRAVHDTLTERLVKPEGSRSRRPLTRARLVPSARSATDPGRLRRETRSK